MSEKVLDNLIEDCIESGTFYVAEQVLITVELTYSKYDSSIEKINQYKSKYSKN